MGVIDTILGIDVIGVHDADGWLINWLEAGAKTTSGAEVTATKALSCSAWFACMRAISEDIAKLPLITYRRLPDGGKERVPKHPAYALLHDSPNDEMGSMNWRETQTHHALGWGGGYAEIERNGAGKPVALWPIHASRVELKRDKQKKLFYRIKAEDVGADPVDLRPHQILDVHGLGPGGVRGYLLHILAQEGIGAALQAEKYGAAFFGNSAEPSGVLRHPAHLSDSALKNLRRTWNQMHQGAVKAHGYAVLEEGMEWQQIGIDPEKAQILATRQFQVEEMARWFRMPPHKVQQLLRATFSNIEHQGIEYTVDTLMPWTVRWEQELKRKLFYNEADIFAEHLFAALLRGDSKQRAEYYGKLFQTGALSPDDILRLENMNVLPDGQGAKHYVPMNMIPIESAGEAKEKPTGNVPAEKTAPDVELIRRAQLPAFESAAARVIAKETKAISRAAKKYAEHEDQFNKWLSEFYSTHLTYVETCLLPVAQSTALLIGVADNRELAAEATQSYAVVHVQNGRDIAEYHFIVNDIDAWCAEQKADSPGVIARVMLEAIINRVEQTDALSQ